MNCLAVATRAERLGQPEQALDRHVHDEFGRLLAGREMDDMGDAVHRPLDGAAVGDRASHDLEPRRWGKRAIVAQSADDEVGMRLRAQPPDEVRSDLSGRARDQEPHLILTGPIASGVGGPLDREAKPCFPIHSLSSRALKRAPGVELRRNPFSKSRSPSPPLACWPLSRRPPPAPPPAHPPTPRSPATTISAA